MQIEPTADRQVIAVTLPGSTDPELAEVISLDVAGCTLLLPDKFKQELAPLLEEILPSLNESLARLPAPSIIGAILILPVASTKAAEQLRLNKESQVELRLPYSGVSLLADLLECWAESLEKVCAIERYLLDQVCVAQQALSEDADAYADNSGLWSALAGPLALDELTQTDYEKRPLLSLVMATAIAKVCRRELQRNLVDDEIVARFDTREKILAAHVQNQSIAKLLHCANEHEDGRLRSACAKLLIHLGDVGTLEKIKGVRELAFVGEPVGAAVIQKLKYLSCLQSVDLSDAYFPPESVNHLTHLPNLKTLAMRNSSAANTSIINLSSSKSVEEIDCSFTQVNDDGARHFLSFRNLKRVKVTGTRVSQTMVVTLRVSGLQVST